MRANNIYFYILFFFVLVFPYCVGGYYVFFCALANIILTVLLLIKIFNEKIINLSFSISAITITLITTAYLVVKIWALDSSMSLHGFIKLLTPFLFMLNVIQVKKERQVYLLYSVSYSAAFMTVSTFVLGQTDAFKTRFFDEAGDLHGAFEYANAYAVFVLVGFFVGIMKPHKSLAMKIADVFCTLICAVGVYLSNSRAVWIIGITVFLLLLYITLFFKMKNKSKKAITILAVLTVIGIIAVIITLIISGFAEKIYKYIITDSSMVERSLYYSDALRYALKHPFGKGAYAFYYAQPEMQSAYYYAIDVHNDYIQMAVEIGIIPTMLFVVLIAFELLSKSNSNIKKTVLLIIALHSMIDYDLQFMAIWCILLLCFNFDREKLIEFKGKIFAIFISVAVIILNFVIGMSAYYNFIGMHDRSVYYYKNTSSMIVLMSRTNDQQNGYNYAKKILEMNDAVFEANHVLSNIYAANKEYDKSIEQMELVLKKDPREMENYENYITLCDTAYKFYNEEGNEKSANKCREKILSVPKILSDLKNNTPDRAKKYGRKQKFTVGKKYMKIINSYK